VGTSAAPDKYGIYTSWNDGLLVEDNRVSGCYNSGIYVANSARNYTIRGNELFAIGGNGIHNNGDLSAGAPGLNFNALIEGNIIHNVGFGIGGQAISCDGVQDSRIQNNLLYDIHSKGISLYGVDAADASKRNAVVNNTVLVAANGYVPLRINEGAVGNVVFNNVFHAATLSGAWIDVEESGLAGLVSDYNLVSGSALLGGAPLAGSRTQVRRLMPEQTVRLLPMLRIWTCCSSVGQAGSGGTWAPTSTTSDRIQRRRSLRRWTRRS
jgi:parallel beta-helix repeat protein